MPDTDSRARQTIARFIRRFDPSYQRLARYAALPLLLTPELVNFLRTAFLFGEVDWIAEADLLLSELCTRVGYELYAMDTEVRSHLLQELEETEGIAKTREVAKLLIGYLQYLERENPSLGQEEQQAQRFAALVYLNTEQAVREIAAAWEKAVDRSQLSRLGRLTEILSPQLRDYPNLVHHAQTVSQLLTDSAKQAEFPQSAEILPGLSISLPDLLRSKHHAIVIGINNYQSSRDFPRNQYAVQDGEKMRQWFTARGFDTVDPLTNPSSTSPFTLEDWRQFQRSRLSQLSLSARDTLWFFFSGYGTRHQGRDYLLFADSNLEAIDRTALALVELVEQLQTTGAGKVILLLDADRDSRRFSPENSPEQQFSSQLTRSFAILYSSSPGQGAYEIDQPLQQGSFTYALLQALRETAGNIPLETLSQFLETRITELNNRYQRPSQTPRLFTHPQTLRQWTPFPSGLQVTTIQTPTVNRSGETLYQDSHLVQYFSQPLGQSTLDMVYIPGGTFWMGTEDKEIERMVKKFNWEGYRREKPRHEVRIKSFYLGKYPITQAQWQFIASRTDLKVSTDLEPNPSDFKGDNRPVERVNWHQAREFCVRLSRLTRQDYRLPSEAEWEYASRAGTTTPFYFGETLTGELANYNVTRTYASEQERQYRKETTPVGQFPPNAFGLYDMHGQVWEWCEDGWHKDYQGAPEDGSAWIFNNDSRFQTGKAIVRGGSWYDDPDDCRSAIRSSFPHDRYDSIGFRVVCVSGRTL
jgi:formylglycine-generating enzyme required for sulfatase activity